MRPFLALLAALLPLLYGAAADAHAFLDHAVPAVGSTVASAPVIIVLSFSEGLEAHFSGAELMTASGQAVAATSTVAPNDDHQLVLKPAQALTPDLYHLSWHVVSVDTHHTQGSFTFTVKP